MSLTIPSRGGPLGLRTILWIWDMQKRKILVVLLGWVAPVVFFFVSITDSCFYRQNYFHWAALWYAQACWQWLCARTQIWLRWWAEESFWRIVDHGEHLAVVAAFPPVFWGLKAVGDRLMSKEGFHATKSTYEDQESIQNENLFGESSQLLVISEWLNFEDTCSQINQ